jgi:hypothetical protein
VLITMSTARCLGRRRIVAAVARHSVVIRILSVESVRRSQLRLARADTRSTGR